jgi:hypothetical protein
LTRFKFIFCGNACKEIKVNTKQHFVTFIPRKFTAKSRIVKQNIYYQKEKKNMSIPIEISYISFGYEKSLIFSNAYFSYVLPLRKVCRIKYS